MMSSVLRPNDERSVEEVDLLSRSTKKVKLVQETSHGQMPKEKTMHDVEGTGNTGEGRHVDGPNTKVPSYRDMVMNLGDAPFKPEEIV